MSEPTDGLASWQSIKIVKAGEIMEVVPAGCYVKEASGDAVLRIYPDGMTTRYTPVAGDYWVVYGDDDGYQSISPKHAFDAGYVLKAGT
jgi:hypothetical protein